MVEQGSRAVGRDIKAMGLIGLGHGTSHFFQLVLPPLFPFLIAEFEVDYAELGVLMTVFFVTGRVAGGSYQATVSLNDMDKKMLAAAFRFCL